MIEFVRELNRNYVKITSDNYTDDYCMKMLESNDITGFVGVSRCEINDCVYHMYNISGCQSLTACYEDKEIKYSEIVKLCEDILAGIRAMEEYMLDPDGAIFDKDYLFWNKEERVWKIVYNTNEAVPVRNRLKRVFEFILNRLDHTDPAAVMYGYGIYKRVCDDIIPIESIFNNASACFEGIKNCDKNNEKERTCTDISIETKSIINNRIIPEEVAQDSEINFTIKHMLVPAVIIAALAIIITAGVILGKIKPVWLFLLPVTVCLFAILYVLLYGRFLSQQTVEEKISVPYENMRHEIKFENHCQNAENKTEIINAPGGGGNKTTILGQIPRLVQLSAKGEDGKEIRGIEHPIYDSPFVIGSSSDSDIVIDACGVSRNHARLSKEGELWFIKDLNSTNGTFVNDHRLSAYEMCPMRDGDIIRLGSFKLELIDTHF